MRRWDIDGLKIKRELNINNGDLFDGLYWRRNEIF